jgi:hypothetical protein
MNDRPRENVRGAATLRFQRQHDELLALAKTLLESLDTRALETDPTVARRALAVFAGRLRVHAAMEQEALYPRLLASTNQVVADKARELLEEIGPLYDQFFKHLDVWSHATAIKSDPEAFCRETMALLYRLRVRMKRENEELYPLADAAAGADAGERPA